MFNNICNCFNKLKVTLVKNKCTQMYFFNLFIYLFNVKYTTNTFTYLCTKV